jgi:hypothetical protein
VINNEVDIRTRGKFNLETMHVKTKSCASKSNETDISSTPRPAYVFWEQVELHALKQCYFLRTFSGIISTKYNVLPILSLQTSDKSLTNKIQSCYLAIVYSFESVLFFEQFV